MPTITSNNDILDSRAIIDRIVELEDWQAEAVGEWDGLSELDRPEAMAHFETCGAARELDTLRAFAAECEQYAEDWQHGVPLIRDSYFEEYARELAEDVGAIKGDETWPCTCIDWKLATDQLKRDYTAVDFDGVTFWVR